jgi:ABC-type branched-subunit amino acid transport system ATPase component
LRQLRGTAATVLIAEQNMHFCLSLASHATVIDKGQIERRDLKRGLVTMCAAGGMAPAIIIERV